MSALGDACPCGSATTYDACCGPLHRNARQAETAEALMRSRYAAYVLGEADHLFRTWHPRTRPADVTPDPRVRWTGLEVLDATEDGDAAEVEFRASYDGGAMHERSRFERRAGRWLYVDGDVS